MTTKNATTTARVLDLDKLVEAEAAVKAEALAFARQACWCAIRDEAVDEARLVAAMKTVGWTASGFADAVRAGKERVAQVQEIRRIPDLEAELKAADPAVQAAEAEYERVHGPARDAHIRNVRNIQAAKARALAELVRLQPLKLRLGESSKNVELRNRRAEAETRQFALERQMNVLRDRRSINEGQTSAARYGDGPAADAKANVARIDREMSETAEGIAAARAVVEQCEHELCVSEY